MVIPRSARSILSTRNGWPQLRLRSNALRRRTASEPGFASSFAVNEASSGDVSDPSGDRQPWAEPINTDVCAAASFDHPFFNGLFPNQQRTSCSTTDIALRAHHERTETASDTMLRIVTHATK